MPVSIKEWRVQATHFEFDGIRIAYWTAGVGKPLLMVHGFPHSVLGLGADLVGNERKA